LDQIKLIIRQFRDLFLRMTGAQQLSIVALGLAVLISMGIFISSAMKSEEPKVLLWRVSGAEGAAVLEKLGELNIKYTLENGVLMVPPTVNIERLRMTLAQDGLLPEDMSFDFEKMIDQDGFTLTKDERVQRYDIALQTELAKNIETMTDILEAKVFITQEEPSPLLKTHLARTASVRVKVRGSRELSKEEVKGIVTFVASGVKGLSPEKVTIIDNRGRPYALNSDSGAADKLEMTWKAERHLAQKIENMLLQFMPRAKATVSLSLDLEKRRRELKDYQHPDLNKNGSAVLVNNFAEKEDSQSKEGSQGVVGAGTNSQADIREGDGGTEMKTGKSTKKEGFDNSLVQEFVTYDGLKMIVTGVSVVVVNKKLNNAYDESQPSSDANKPYLDATWISGNAQGATLQELVATAIGLSNPTMVKITEQDMEMPSMPVAQSTLSKALASMDLYLIFMLVLSLVGVGILVKMVRKAQPEEEILEMPEYEDKDAEDDLPPLKEPELDPHIRQVENRVKEIVDEDPVKAASLIRHWLSSE
jgi:flagellar M-ring protein FliF